MSANRRPLRARRTSLLRPQGPERLEERRLLSVSPGRELPVVQDGETAFVVAGAVAGSAPRVQVLDAVSGQERLSFLAYGSAFLGGVRVASGDVNGDGTEDIITAPGAGGGPHIRVFNGVDGTVLREFLAYDRTFTGGVFVAAGDVDGDGLADVVTGAGAGGGPHVRVFSGADGSVLPGFFAYGAAFTGGVRVAADDVDGDGRAEIITGAGPGGGPHVRVFSGVDRRELLSLLAYDAAFAGGVFVAAGDLNGDGRADLVAGAGAGGGPHVRALDGASGAELASFFAFDGNYARGVPVAVGAGQIVVGGNPASVDQVRTFNLLGQQQAQLQQLSPDLNGGVFVAAGLNVAVPSAPTDDTYEDNDTRTQASDLGLPVTTQTIDNLVLADAEDWFQFRTTATGGASHSVRLAFEHDLGNVDLALYDAAGTLLASSTSATDAEEISLASQPAGNYYVRVYGDQGAFNPLYSLTVTPPAAALASDDAYEDNDTLAQAANLGTLSSLTTLTGLQVRDSADWFRFTTTGTGAASAFVRVEFQHSQGDVDLVLYNSSGVAVRASDSVTNSEQVSLQGLAAGVYYVRVYGYQGVHNPSYSLTIDPALEAGGGGGGGGTGGGGGGSGGTGNANTLYVNFDGAAITTTDLARYAGNQWSPFSFPGGSNGITVSPFFANRSDREQIISGILSRLQTDLTPFGITVQRHNGLAVEGVGATTLFAGPSTLSHPHVASDVDFGNNNNTDIAFIGEENWGSAASIILAMSDVFLHEAGHTYGLYHTEVLVGGVLYAESMGLRYSADNQNDWVRDTSFLDRTFVEFRDEDGNWHGLGGGQLQNSFQTMRANFGITSAPAAGQVATFNSTQDGVLSIAFSDAADQLSIVQLDAGLVELVLNGQHYTISGDVDRIEVTTQGDAADQIDVVGELQFELLVSADGADFQQSQAKLAADGASFWNGTALSHRDPHAGCGCPMCQGAVAGALNAGFDELSHVAAGLSASVSLLSMPLSPAATTGDVDETIWDAALLDVVSELETNAGPSTDAVDRASLDYDAQHRSHLSQRTQRYSAASPHEDVANLQLDLIIALV